MAHPIEQEQARLDRELHEAFGAPSVLEAIGFMLDIEHGPELAEIVDRQLREADRHSGEFVRSMRNTRRAAAASGLIVGVSLGRSVGRLEARGEPVTRAEAERRTVRLLTTPDGETLVCPACGETPELAEIGVLTRERVGEYSTTTEPSPEGVRYRCSGGHWFDERGRAAGPPRDMTVREGG